jgi:hypothetical protein
MLALLVVLVAGLPVQAWARLAEVCREADGCACRHDDAATSGPEARRIDCCEVPRDASLAAAPVLLSGSDRVAAVLPTRELVQASCAEVRGRPCAVPGIATRGPPTRWFGMIEHWLL